MTAPAELEARIRMLNWPGLRCLWAAIRRGASPGWQPGEAFEYLVLRAFELENTKTNPVRVRYPYSVRLFDEQVEEIDGAVHLAETSFLVESKDWADSVPIGPIAKMRNQLLRRPAGTIGLLFALRGFTASAVALARFTPPQAILLWTGQELDAAIGAGEMCRFLRIKLRRCVEDGVPDYDILEAIIS